MPPCQAAPDGGVAATARPKIDPFGQWGLEVNFYAVDHPVHRLDLSDYETVHQSFAKWVIFNIVADVALLSRRADRLMALTLATMVMASWG